MENPILMTVDVAAFSEEPSRLKELESRAQLQRRVHSSAGLETVELVFSAVQLIFSLLELEYITQAVSRQQITVKYRGFVLTGSVKRIVRTLMKDPMIKTEVLQALKDKSLEISGDIQQISLLRQKLEDMMPPEDENG